MMELSNHTLRDDAIAIWQAGVDAVRSDRLVRDVLLRERDRLKVCDQEFSLSRLRRIVVVGAGKAGAGMAAGVEEALGDELVDEKVSGWVNVPADCLRPLRKIHLHAARPAGVNEPTAEGVAGAEEILRIVGGLTRHDLCLVLISGGGSALLPAPKPPITLEDKQAVTRFLMQSGATITEMNVVRKRLSRIKGGGLARASRAGDTIALIISDIVGDPLDMIASGPLCPDAKTDEDALAVLRKFDARPPHVPQAVLSFLSDDDNDVDDEDSDFDGEFESNADESIAHFANHLIGNNAMAIEAAEHEARRRGYFVSSLGSENAGNANDEGRYLAALCRAHRAAGAVPECILSGGEPVVHLNKTDRPRKGGRNQQLVLAALDALQADGMNHIVLLSGGTDGEDGPTDAAGAWADAQVLQTARQRGLDPKSFLEINDSYGFFSRAGGLLKTGPTHTNVMDLRVALVVP